MYDMQKNKRVEVNMSQILILLAIVLYLIFVVIVGVFFSKKNNSTEDFYLGGRKLGPLVTAMSAEASDMSSWLLMGQIGRASCRERVSA